MKRSIWFFILALFVFLVIDPNLTAHLSPEQNRIPVYNPEAPLQTNNDVETQRSSSNKLIVIDPARGGQDTGYTSSTTQPEKDLLMQLALTIGGQLEKAGYRIEYTRWYDDVPACGSLQECDSSRLTKARELGADYVLSLALNQDDSGHRGFSILTQPDNATLALLSRELDSRIAATSFSRNEGIDTDHYDSFPVLSDPSLPAVLIQMGYITSPSDYARLSDSKFQARLADAITQSFLSVVD